jgi:O-antigen/teichoic acid export membrane protein
MPLKVNIIANFAGQAWRALMSLAFLPVYIHYLGAEAYGLIGIFATLQAWLGLLDMGLRPALSREMALYTGGAHDTKSIGDLLRSAEILTICVAALVALGVLAASGWLASSWVQAERLSHNTIAQAFTVMGIVAAFQCLESLYMSVLTGLQRQVLQNAILGFFATLRAVGAVTVLMWVSPTLIAFFVWQGIVSLGSVVTLVACVYRVLPRSAGGSQFSWPALIAVREYAAGIAGITFVALLLTQVDKVLLSHLLPLEVFGQYTLAAIVAGSLSVLSTPIGAALHPHLTELVARNDEVSTRLCFHQNAQLLSVLVGSAAAMLIVFCDRILLHWMHDLALVERVTPLLRVLTVGAMLNAVISLPYLLQLAHGWTSLTLRLGFAAVAVLVPAIPMVVPRYGAIGAAWVWTVFNISYALIAAQFMFRRLVKTEKWNWYVQDVGLPLAAALATAFFIRSIMPPPMSAAVEIALLTAAGLIVTTCAILVSPLVKCELRHLASGKIASRARVTINQPVKACDSPCSKLLGSVDHGPG